MANCFEISFDNVEGRASDGQIAVMIFEPQIWENLPLNIWVQSLRKQAYSNILKHLPPKNEKV